MRVILVQNRPRWSGSITEQDRRERSSTTVYWCKTGHLMFVFTTHENPQVNIVLIRKERREENERKGHLMLNLSGYTRSFLVLLSLLWDISSLVVLWDTTTSILYRRDKFCHRWSVHRYSLSFTPITQKINSIKFTFTVIGVYRWLVTSVSPTDSLFSLDLRTYRNTSLRGWVRTGRRMET